MLVYVLFLSRAWVLAWYLAADVISVLPVWRSLWPRTSSWLHVLQMWA